MNITEIGEKMSQNLGGNSGMMNDIMMKVDRELRENIKVYTYVCVCVCIL